MSMQPLVEDIIAYSIYDEVKNYKGGIDLKTIQWLPNIAGAGAFQLIVKPIGDKILMPFVSPIIGGGELTNQAVKLIGEGLTYMGISAIIDGTPSLGDVFMKQLAQQAEIWAYKQIKP